MDDVRLIDANIVMSKLKAEVDNIPKRTNYPIGIADGISYAMATIDCAQTVDAQPVKQGKWEWEPGYVGTTAKCSACGLSPLGFYSLPKIQIGRLPEYKFCPNCGADMRGNDADS